MNGITTIHDGIEPLCFLSGPSIQSLNARTYYWVAGVRGATSGGLSSKIGSSCPTIWGIHSAETLF